MVRSLEDRINAEPAAGWKPEKGDSVIGEIVSISEAPGTNWGPYPLIEIEKDDGTAVAVHAFHGVLKGELERLAPNEGDRIGIKYLGKKQGTNQEYEAYNVALERATPKAVTSTPANGSTSAPTSTTPTASPVDDDEEPF